MATVTVSAARATLASQITRVQAGEEVAITQHGEVVAVLIRPDLLNHRRASRAWDLADQVGTMLTEARERPLPTVGISAERAEELVAEVAQDRLGR